MLNNESALEITGCTDTGLSRDHNEDYIGYDDVGIAVLADGMGGHQAGEIASKMAVEGVLDQLKAVLANENGRSVTGSQMLNVVSNTISSSNRKIFEASEANIARSGMGTTVVAAVIKDSRLYAGHVGDSRLYLLRNSRLKRITKDHSLVQDLIDKGFYTEDEAKIASINHVVTRALGTSQDVEVDILQQNAKQDDVFLLCSDGLSDMLSDAMMEQVLKRPSKSLNEKAQKLVGLANHFGGKDNISVILIKVDSINDN
jgi:protein phosphatase